jgi:hypothetical protein
LAVSAVLWKFVEMLTPHMGEYVHEQGTFGHRMSMVIQGQCEIMRVCVSPRTSNDLSNRAQFSCRVPYALPPHFSVLQSALKPPYICLLCSPSILHVLEEKLVLNLLLW